MDLRENYARVTSLNYTCTKQTIVTKGRRKCIKIFIKIHQNDYFDGKFDAFELDQNFHQNRKKKKEEKNRIWWSLMKFVLDQTFHQNNCAHQTRFYVLMHLSRFIKKKFLSHRVECKKHIRWSVFRIFWHSKIRKTKTKIIRFYFLRINIIT